MKNLGIVANLNKAGATVQAKRIDRWLKNKGINVVFEKSLAGVLNAAERSFELGAAGTSLEALIVLGGDGTMINTFHHLGRRNLPLLGINLGGLGFLTEVTLEEIPVALKDLVQGKLKVNKRATLDCFWPGKKGAKEIYSAINDIVIGKGGLARVIQLEAFVDGEYLTAYLADGLIIATPTGSTAYSLSAHGPIVSPGTDVILITPICPHTLTNRPILVSSDRVIEVKLVSGPPDTTLTIDGQIGIPIEPGDTVKIGRGKKELKLLTSPRSSYCRILRSKLNWGGRSHYKK